MDFVTVSIRIKPNLNQNAGTNPSLQVISSEPPVLFLTEKAQTYNFDNIFTEDSTQESVYKTVKPLVENAKLGYNCTVFTYGQTGTGKTYTMGTNPGCDSRDSGLISRSLEDLFDSINTEENETELFISFIEVYNEKVFDLLTENGVPLPVKGFAAQGFNKERVANLYEAKQLLKMGRQRRHTAETRMNLNSSRSHAIFTIYCYTRDNTQETIGKLNLVDLAGSENVRKTGNQGGSFHEAVNINKGLLNLGQVMMALSKDSSHIPYRSSMITTILQDSLNKKNFVSLIACVSGSSEDLVETSQTLEFAFRVKRIKNKPEVNQIICQFKRDNPYLFVSKFTTPVKRPTETSFETPFHFKKPGLPIIQEPNNSNFESCSANTSSSSISTEAFHQNLSPVIKKYVNTMESSILTKLREMENTLRRPSTRRSKQLEDQENCTTPSFSWDKVKKIIRSEIVQLTGQIKRATSSPMELQMDKAIKPRKILPLAENSDILNLTGNELRNGSPELSPLAPIPMDLDVSETEEVERVPINQSVRKSTRIAARKSIVSPPSQNRKSVHLQTKNSRANMNFEFKTPKTPKKISRVKKESSTIVKERTKNLLHTLNHGSLRELETLQTVGIKTAEKILIQRQLNGGFRTVADLMLMPSWTDRKHKRFLDENFVNNYI